MYYEQLKRKEMEECEFVDDMLNIYDDVVQVFLTRINDLKDEIDKLERANEELDSENFELRLLKEMSEEEAYRLESKIESLEDEIYWRSTEED